MADPVTGLVLGEGVGPAETTHNPQTPGKDAARIETGPGFKPQPYGDPKLRAVADPNAGQRFGPSNVSDPNALTRQPQGFDQTSPGVLEQFQQNQQGQLLGPSASQNFNSQAMGGYMGTPTQSGQLSADPGLDKYYDRARERQAGSMNDQMAARGGYGSSAGLDMMMQGQSDLNAQQANREADYAMSAAGQADQARAAQMGLGLQGANQADATQLSRLRGGAELAGAAQDAHAGRFQNFFNNERANRNDMANLVQPWMMGMLDADGRTMDAAMALEMGAPRDQVNFDFANNAARTDRVNTAANFADTAAGFAPTGPK